MRSVGHFSLVHGDPLVLFAPEWEIKDPASAVWSVFHQVSRRPAYLIIGPAWFLGKGRAAFVAKRLRELARSADVTVVASCATVREAALAEHWGLPAIHCSVSAFTREDFFVPLPGRRPRFDAIYDARWTDFKRHDLAASVRSLALIAARSVEQTPCTLGYSVRAHLAVRHATWLASPRSPIKPRWLSRDELNAAYNQARVGLCLSQTEGVMFASLQYLLAGLPVVTTRNLGGRDEFFNADHVRWVDDDPLAVARAVGELIALDLDPQAIRDAALVKVGEHRRRMQTWLQEAIQRDGCELGRWAGDWPEGLPNKLREPVAQVADVLAELGATGLRAA